MSFTVATIHLELDCVSFLLYIVATIRNVGELELLIKPLTDVLSTGPDILNVATQL